MLLHGSRQRIQVTRSRMRGKRLPCRQCCACGTHRGVDIFRRSLRHTGEPLARGRISGLEVAVFGGRLKGPVDEMSEAPLMAIEPGQRLLRILWRGAVFHSDEFFSDAHVAVLILVPRTSFVPTGLAHSQMLPRAAALGCIIAPLCG